MPAYIMQFRRRIGMLLLAIVLLLSIALVALFLVEQPTVSSNDPYGIYKEQNYLNVLSGWYNYSDSGELSVFVIYIMYVDIYMSTENEWAYFDVHVIVYRDKFLTIKPTRCTDYSNLFLE
jgi:hypothetical protein